MVINRSIRSATAILLGAALFITFMPGMTFTSHASSKSSKLTYVTKKNVSLGTGTVKTLKYKTANKSKNIAWKSSKPSVVSVSGKGQLQAKKIGRAVVSVRVGKQKLSWNVLVKKSDVKAKAVSRKTVLVTPKWVKSVIDGNQKESKNYRILEVAYGSQKDDKDYQNGHVPGAVHCDSNSVEESGDYDYYNLLSPQTLQENLLKLGITADTTVIVYGDDPSCTARVAYAYLYEGVKNVKFMNGSLAAWKKAGYAVQKKSVSAKKAKSFGVKVPAHPEYQTSIDQVKDKLKNEKNFRLVSIRSEAEWLGKTSGYSYITRAGEPKGAVWGHGGSDPYHMEDYTESDGKTLISPEKMIAKWKKWNVSFDGSNDLAFYCGTGWRASIPFLISYQAGFKNISVYDGGWYQWQSIELDSVHHTDSTKNEVQVGDPGSSDVVYTTVDQLPTDKATGHNENQNG